MNVKANRDEVKSKQILFKVTMNELQAIKRLAKNNGLSMSEHIRRSSLNPFAMKAIKN